MLTLRNCFMATNCIRVLRLAQLEFSNMPDLANHSIIRTVDKAIENNTHLFIESPIHIKILPIDVNDIEMHHKLVMQLFSLKKNTAEFAVKQTSKRLELISANKTGDYNDICVIRVPLQLKVHINTTADACVDISQMQGEEFIVKTEKGKVTLKDIQAKEITVETASGDFTSHGRIQASKIGISTAGNAGISCNNIMSNDLSISTHKGPIKVKSCYSDKSHFITASGNIKLENVHRKCIIDVIENGDVHITSFEGQLLATLKSGDVLLHAARLTDRSSIFVHEKGKVDVMLASEIKEKTSITLIADRIKVEGTIQNEGRLMTDAHPERFRYPIEDDKRLPNELLVECRNGIVNLKESNAPFFTILS